MPCPTRSRTHAEAEALRIGLNGGGNVVQMIAGLSELDSLKKALARHVNQLSGLWLISPTP